MKLAGDCMEPEIPDGSKCAVSKSEPYQCGDLVVVYLWPEYVNPGHHRAIVKRLALGLPPCVKSFPYKDHPESEVQAVVGLSMNSMPGKMMMVPCAHIAAIQRVIAIMKPGEKSYRQIVRPGEVLARRGDRIDCAGICASGLGAERCRLRLAPGGEAMTAENKPEKIELSSDMLEDLNGRLRHAVDLVNCAFYATHNWALIPKKAGDPLRTALDDAVSDINEVRVIISELVE